MLIIESARKIVLQGAVQGCGVRPALARLAISQGWSGSVKNTNHGVELLIQGPLPGDAELQALLQAALPVGSSLAAMIIHRCQPTQATGFCIENSTDTESLLAHIPRDRANCADCFREIYDPGSRRYHDPFVTCAQCGPRYSILSSMPFDRERTAMNDFVPCSDCVREYHDPHDRR